MVRQIWWMMPDASCVTVACVLPNNSPPTVSSAACWCATSPSTCRQFRYNLDYRFSADYDWCIRILQHAARCRNRVINTHLILTDYLSEGLTTKNHRRSLMERFRIMAKHYGTSRAVCAHLWFVLRALFRR